jgi:lipid-binding SYLF domain-containing protein
MHTMDRYLIDLVQSRRKALALLNKVMNLGFVIRGELLS